MKKIFLSVLLVCLFVTECVYPVCASENIKESTAPTESGELSVEYYNYDSILSEEESSSNDLNLYGSAVQLEDQSIQLTALSTWKSGSAWQKDKINTKNGFEVSFSYWAGGGRNAAYGGADGIILMMSEETGLGAQGGDMGFTGANTYGVELDSYAANEGDPDGKHIAIIQGSVKNHLNSVLDDRVDDSQWHTLSVFYVSSALSVTLDEQEVLTCQGIMLPDEIYLGISAATGGGMNQHIIKDFGVIVFNNKNFYRDTEKVEEVFWIPEGGISSMIAEVTYSEKYVENNDYILLYERQKSCVYKTTEVTETPILNLGFVKHIGNDFEKTFSSWNTDAIIYDPEIWEGGSTMSNHEFTIYNKQSDVEGKLLFLAECSGAEIPVRAKSITLSFQ